MVGARATSSDVGSISIEGMDSARVRAKTCAMSSQSSLLMPFVAPAGNACCVAAFFMVLARATSSDFGSIGRMETARARGAKTSSGSGPIEGMVSARARGATVDLGEVLVEAKTCAMRSHSSLVMAFTHWLASHDASLPS